MIKCFFSSTTSHHQQDDDILGDEGDGMLEAEERESVLETRDELAEKEDKLEAGQHIGHLINPVPLEQREHLRETMFSRDFIVLLPLEPL